MLRIKIILKIICALDLNKANDHGNISTAMTRICDSTMVKPSTIIFHNSLNSGIIPKGQKKSNIVPVHEKANK